MISVIGLGFVGLTTALGFAHYGHTVYGVDVNKERVETLRRKELPFIEPGLDDALVTELGTHFFIEDSVKEAVKNSSIIFFCVGTPYGENGKADLQYLLTAIKECVENRDINKKYTFVVKSTIPPTTTEEVVIPYIESLGVKVGEDVYVANNPEFLREGHCWDDFVKADRIVVGTLDGETQQVMEEIYRPFDIPMYFVTYNTGEFIKYLSNTLLATMISFSNEMAAIANDIGNIDIKDAFKILHMDKRWNDCNMKTYVYPGCGYGGYCLPKDTKALYSLAQGRGLETGILQNVIKTNDNMASTIVKRIKKKVSAGARIGILGLSFKPESDDVRDSAAAKIIAELISEGYTNIAAYDPVAIDEFKRAYQFDIDYVPVLSELENDADVFVIVTAWEEFRKIKEKSKKPVLDYRYM